MYQIGPMFTLGGGPFMLLSKLSSQTKPVMPSAVAVRTPAACWVPRPMRTSRPLAALRGWGRWLAAALRLFSRFRCLFSRFHCLSLCFHCLSLCFYCRLLSFLEVYTTSHCIFLVFFSHVTALRGTRRCAVVMIVHVKVTCDYPCRILGKSKIRILSQRVGVALSTLGIPTRR